MIKTYAKVLTGFYKLCIIYLYYEKRKQQRENTQTDYILCITPVVLASRLGIYYIHRRNAMMDLFVAVMMVLGLIAVWMIANQ